MNDHIFKRTSLFLLSCIFIHQSSGEVLIRVSHHNLLNYPTSEVLQDSPSFFGANLGRTKSNLLTVYELSNGMASEYLFENVLTFHNTYSVKTALEGNQLRHSNLLQLEYGTSKELILENSSVVAAGKRNISQHIYIANIENTSTQSVRGIEVFPTNLKVSTGSSSWLGSFNSILSFANALNDVPKHSRGIFAADYNFYSSNEKGYQYVTNDRNPIAVIDPIDRSNLSLPEERADYCENYTPIYFRSNGPFSDLHAQSTTISNSSSVDDTGVVGCVNEWFDFILLLENFSTSLRWHHLNGWYRTIDNHRNCHDESINRSNYFDKLLQIQKTSFQKFSDHPLVIPEIKTPENTLTSDLFVKSHFLNSNDDRDCLHLSTQSKLFANCLRMRLINGQLVQKLRSESFQIEYAIFRSMILVER